MRKISFLCALLLLPVFSVHAEKIQHNTISDFLQTARQQAEAEGRKANHLINESSPYLLQHAYNPVNWYPWGEEAFAKARKENKPIFLSIGYSTCHWCHVMARESFENKKIAALLNKYFVCIKVDREQRPDIDNIYMAATQLINGHGGWPMSVFIDNQLRPFHAATYYPPFSTEKHPGFEEVLLKIHDLWINQPEEVKRTAAAVTANISATADDSTGQGTLLDNIKQQALQQINDIFDEESGGFGSAPKFPRPGIFSLLIHMAEPSADLTEKAESEQKMAAKMIGLTLDMMAAGGIYDQVAGGFHRYSVDANWQVPHFEKMLYNQALMVMAYSDYYPLNAMDKYKTVVFETLAFVLREMRSAEGGYYSALDADSERPDKPGQHAEGAYYLWSEAELKKLLLANEFQFIKKYFHIRARGNILSDPQNEFTDLNIFYIDEEFRNEKLEAEEKKLLDSVKRKLKKQRRLRPGPHLDDKILTAWNGMMLAAFAKASRVFNEPSFLDEAIQSVSFIKNKLYDNKHKKLYRQYRNNKAGTDAALSDYVWLIYGLLEIYETSEDRQWLNWAVELQHTQNALFLDKASGSYFESLAGDSSLLFRSKNIYDDALPADNAIALTNLRKLAGFIDNPDIKKTYNLQADHLVAGFAWVINQNPAAASMLLSVEMQKNQ